MTRAARNTVPVLLAIGSAWAQTRAAAQDDPSQLVSDLAKQVRQLRIEVTTLRLEWHERRMQTLEQKIRAAERERRLAEYEDAAGRDQVLTAELQLAGKDLDDAERAELTGLRDALLTDGQRSLRQRRTEATEHESFLRKQWERERAAAEEFRRTLKSLRLDAEAGLKPAP